MERNIDMRQTVEEAAKLFSNRCRIANCQSSLGYLYDDIDMINAFQSRSRMAVLFRRGDT